MKLIKTTKVGEKQVSVYETEKSMTFHQMFGEIVGTPAEEKLKAHVFEEAEMDALLQQGIGLDKNGLGNFFPVEDENGLVSVADVHWSGARWYRYRYSLDHDAYVWYPGYRLVVSNSDSLTLEKTDTLSLASLTARVEAWKRKVQGV